MAHTAPKGLLYLARGTGACIIGDPKTEIGCSRCDLTGLDFQAVRTNFENCLTLRVRYSGIENRLQISAQRPGIYCRQSPSPTEWLLL